MRIVLIVVMISMILIELGQAQVGPPKDLWKGLIAEAVEDGPAGMLAVAHVVSNRLKKGMDCGLVGLKRADLDRFVANEGPKAEVMAKEAVKCVFGQGEADPTHGALWFESTRYPKPWWAYGKIITVHIGHHLFYR